MLQRLIIYLTWRDINILLLVSSCLFPKTTRSHPCLENRKGPLISSMWLWQLLFAQARLVIALRAFAAWVAHYDHHLVTVLSLMSLTCMLFLHSLAIIFRKPRDLLQKAKTSCSVSLYIGHLNKCCIHSHSQSKESNKVLSVVNTLSGPFNRYTCTHGNSCAYLFNQSCDSRTVQNVDLSDLSDFNHGMDAGARGAGLETAELLGFSHMHKLNGAKNKKTKINIQWTAGMLAEIPC